MAATVIQRRRGSNTDHGTFAGALAELTVDITQNRLVVHDGATPGGHPVAKKTEVDGKASIAAALSDMNLTDVKNNLNFYERDEVDDLLVSPVAGRRNRLVNGNMRVSQENGVTAGTVSGFYPVDQWVVAHLSDGAFSAQMVQVDTPDGSLSRVRISVTSADVSLSASQCLFFYQKLEGTKVSDILFGKSTARDLIARFGFKGPAGTYSFYYQNAATNRSYVKSFTVAPGDADTDILVEIPIPGDTTGTWPNGLVHSATFGICLAAGSSLVATDGQWYAGNAIGVTGMSNGLGSSANVFEIFDCGLKLDRSSIGSYGLYESQDYADTYRECCRYYYKSSMIVDVASNSQSHTLPALMRTQPTWSGGGAGFTATGWSASQTGFFYQTARSTQTLVASARM